MSTGNLLSFLVFVAKGRWFTVFASLMMMAGCGTIYFFGIYSKELKVTFGYDQETLNLLSLSKELGVNIGIYAGLIAEVTPTRFVLLIGAAMNFSGYFMIWLAVTGKIAKPQIWQMCAYIYIAANSMCFINTGIVPAYVKNFPESRGFIIGLLKGYIGLSAAIITQIYIAIYGVQDRKSIILLIGWLPAAITLVFLHTIRPIRFSTENQQQSQNQNKNQLRVFFQFLYASIGLALFLMAITLTQKSVVFPRAAQAVTATVVCIIVLLPLWITVREELVNWKLIKQAPQITIEKPQEVIPSKQEDPASSSSQREQQELEYQEVKKPKRASFVSNVFNKPPRGDDYTISQALFSIDMLIIFIATLFGLGSSFTATDNLGQIVEALGYKPQAINTFVSLHSIWNFFGRIFSGFASEILLMKYKIPRPLMLTLALILASFGYLFIVFPFHGSLYFASVIIGFTLGLQLPLCVTIISELFGLKHYALLLNFSQLISPLASYILSVKITGALYDKEANKELARLGLQRIKGQPLTCIGTQCYKLSFTILTAVTLFAALGSLVLVKRTLKFYRSDIYKKFRDNAEKVVKAEEK